MTSYNVRNILLRDWLPDCKLDSTKFSILPWYQRKQFWTSSCNRVYLPYMCTFLHLTDILLERLRIYPLGFQFPVLSHTPFLTAADGSLSGTIVECLVCPLVPSLSNRRNVTPTSTLPPYTGLCSKALLSSNQTCHLPPPLLLGTPPSQPLPPGQMFRPFSASSNCSWTMHLEHFLFHGVLFIL